MDWRPEGWENPFAKVDDLGMYVIPIGENNITNKRTAFEAGASAMLEALRAVGTPDVLPLNLEAHPYPAPLKMTKLLKGTWVFIPDKKGKDEKMDT